MSRADHLFTFHADEIADAARGEAKYHEDRLAYWKGEYEVAATRVEETIGAKIDRQQVTGGERVVVVVDYGDPAAYKRLQEAWEKSADHREAAERFRTDERLYGTQSNRVYELTTEDVHYYRLGGGPRED